MSKDAADDAKRALRKFVVSLAIADARRDHLIATGKLQPDERRPMRSSADDRIGSVTVRFVADCQDPQ